MKQDKFEFMIYGFEKRNPKKLIIFSNRVELHAKDMIVNIDYNCLNILRNMYQEITDISLPHFFTFKTSDIFKEIDTNFIKASNTFKNILIDLKLECNMNKYLNSPYYITQQMLKDYMHFTMNKKDKNYLLKRFYYNIDNIYYYFIDFIKNLYRFVNEKNVFLISKIENEIN